MFLSHRRRRREGCSSSCASRAPPSKGARVKSTSRESLLPRGQSAVDWRRRPVPMVAGWTVAATGPTTSEPSLSRQARLPVPPRMAAAGHGRACARRDALFWASSFVINAQKLAKEAGNGCGRWSGVGSDAAGRELCLLAEAPGIIIPDAEASQVGRRARDREAGRACVGRARCVGRAWAVRRCVGRVARFKET